MPFAALPLQPTNNASAITRYAPKARKPVQQLHARLVRITHHLPRRWWRLCVLPLAITLVSCGGPQIRLDAPVRASATLPVITGTGFASPQQENSLVDQALRSPTATVATDDLLDAVRGACPLAPLVAANQVTVLNDGPSTFQAFAAAVGNAVHHIHLETYIFADDALGRSFAALLAEKSQQGIEVRVLYDGFGSFAASAEFFDNLRRAGVQVVAFRPLEDLTHLVTGDINNRDHRKILIVDGRTAFVGGINITEAYNSGSGSSPRGAVDLKDGWRDVQVKIEGPVVKQFQSLFFSSWVRSGGTVDTSSTAYYPALSAHGHSLIAAVASEYAAKNEGQIQAVYLAIIRHAQRRIWITQAYFTPDESLLEALMAAARRGVDIRVLVPGFSDSSLVLNASRSIYDRLLVSGVRIFEYETGFVHSKTLTVDGALSIVGSANMDIRSLLHNNEVAAVIADNLIAAELDAFYLKDVNDAREIRLIDWRARPLRQRAMERAATLMWFWI
jgi:cardiolipin synthase A/B